jgi:membrane-associated protein
MSLPAAAPTPTGDQGAALFMEYLQHAIDFFRHVDVYLNHWIGLMGPWFYAVLFLIVFAETGLVVTPLLPGDSLLFATGALAAREGSPLSMPVLLAVLILAAVLGDAVNYYIGYRVGPRVFKSERSRLFNKKHLLRAQEFYEKYGGKTIILARFMPIIRTFAPFVAGIGKMEYRRFALYNVTGAIAWVLICVIGGYLLSEVEIVKKHFELILVAIVIISVLPGFIEFLLARRRAATKEPAAANVE